MVIVQQAAAQTPRQAKPAPVRAYISSCVGKIRACLETLLSGLEQAGLMRGGLTRRMRRFEAVRSAFIVQLTGQEGRSIAGSAPGAVAAAKVFFAKAIGSQGLAPETITPDGFAASHRAAREMKVEGLLPEETTLKSSRYLKTGSTGIIATSNRGWTSCSASNASGTTPPLRSPGSN
ncbi:hypothetical protein P3T40_007901 [Paraburkholderia sp. EB58]|jgi:hypothetical protein